MQADGAERLVGDGGAAEGEVEVREGGAAEGEDFGGGVGEGAAEGLWGEGQSWDVGEGKVVNIVRLKAEVKRGGLTNGRKGASLPNPSPSTPSPHSQGR